MSNSFCERCIEKAAREVHRIRFTEPAYSDYDQNRRDWIADAFIEMLKDDLARAIKEEAFVIKKQEEHENEHLDFTS